MDEDEEPNWSELILGGGPLHHHQESRGTVAGRVLTYEHLLSWTWWHEPASPMRAAKSSLRRKLGDEAEDPTYIFTELRVGYRMPKGEK